jgi:hypothetical protein
MTYPELFAACAPLVESGGELWTRQMVLGPAREFCVRAESPVAFPSTFDALVIRLRPLWPELANEPSEPGANDR